MDLFRCVYEEDRCLLEEASRGQCAGILGSPDGAVRIPVYFRKNSLSVFAHVRKVKEKEAEQSLVRAVYVKMQVDVDSLKLGWQFLSNGNPVHKQHGKSFVDPSEALSTRVWKFRTTIVLVGAVWEVVEHSKALESLPELTADIPGILIPTTILTFPQRHVEPLSACLCEPVLESQLSEIVDEFEKKDNAHEMFQREPEIPVELQGAPSMHFSGGHEEQPESLWINGKEVSKQSKVKDLQDACNFLGVNASGSKTKLFDRLCSYFSREHRKDMESIKHNLQQQMLGPQAKIQTKGAEKPDDPKIIERHEVTHLPFAPWCDSCLKTKSREDKMIQNTDAAEEDSGVPHIQMDWMYLGRNCPALILLDTTTRYGAIFPARSKGVWRALAEFCVRFSLGHNYLSEVVYVMDSEPATLGLLDMVVMVRQEMGYPTSKKVGKPYHKGRTARVERYIQTVRRHASTLMTSVEDHIHEVLHDLHCLRAWSLVHAVFLLNRFHEHSAIKATAFETVFGRQYNGKLLPFGEFAFGLRKPMKKTRTSVWQGGIWIGKDESDMHVLRWAVSYSFNQKVLESVES